jgi:hypothetical protein
MLPHPTEERRLGERETEGGGAVHGDEGPLSEALCGSEVRTFNINHLAELAWLAANIAITTGPLTGPIWR